MPRDSGWHHRKNPMVIMLPLSSATTRLLSSYPQILISDAELEGVRYGPPDWLWPSQGGREMEGGLDPLPLPPIMRIFSRSSSLKSPRPRIRFPFSSTVPTAAAAPFMVPYFCFFFQKMQQLAVLESRQDQTRDASHMFCFRSYTASV